MAKTELSVDELVNMIERGRLRLPEMQRRYVWRSTRVRDLMDSLYRGYPSGAILVWESDDEVPVQDMAVVQEQSGSASNPLLLLDGQQRLSSLSALLRGVPLTVRGRKRPIQILFNLEHPDKLSFVTGVNEDSDEDTAEGEDTADVTEDDFQQRFESMAFVVGTKRLAGLPHWVDVSEVLNSGSDMPFIRRAGVTSMDDPRFEKYTQRLARLRGIRKYMYRVDVLERTLDYDEVTEIFVRVNSLGAKLRGSDLALAQITAKWKKSLVVFQEFQVDCAKKGFNLELGVHLKNLIVFATGQSRFLTVSRLSNEQLQKAWSECRDGMEYAINFLKSNAGIDSPALLSSPFLIICLAAYGHRRGYSVSPEESDRLRFWTLLANAKARYSRGSTETFLDQDIAVLREGGVNELIERLRLQVGRLSIEPEELEGRNQRSALFKTMFLAFRAAGAKDWGSQLAIALSHSGSQHRLQFHHLFPKAILKGRYAPRQRDDIANLCFIGGKTNRSISNKRPADYFPAILNTAGPGVFEAQQIPTDPNLLTEDAYGEFLKVRRQMIAKRLNEFLGTAT